MTTPSSDTPKPVEAAPVPQEPASSERIAIDPNKLFLPAAILIAGTMISGTLLYTRAQVSDVVALPPEQPERVDVSIDDDPVLGNPQAKVTIIEFSDYECPFCQRFWLETFPQIKAQYIDTGKVKFVYRDYPLTSIHAGAMPAAQAAQCAGEQGKYWEMHDVIFSSQIKGEKITASNLKKWAGSIGLNLASFDTCVASEKYASEVEKDLQDGIAAGVEGTPSFFVNGWRIKGAQPFESFKQLIEQEL